MNIFITGGAGFIGSNFCDWALKQHELEKLYILDKFTYAGMRESIEPALANSKTELIEGDICDPCPYSDAILDSDYLVNFAAESHVDNSITGPEEFIQTNIYGTFQLLEVLRKSPKKMRFLQISTDEVYGSLSFDSESSTENSSLNPSSPYSASKASADHLALSYQITYGMDVVVTRSSNNFGPKQIPEKFIPKIINNAHQNEKIPVYGKGLNTRDWIYVEDNCQGIGAAMKNGRAGSIYHLGSGNEINNLNIVKTILSSMGKSEELIEYVKDRPGHDLRYSLATEKTEKELDWKANDSFDEQLQSTINWYLENDQWLEAARKSLAKR